MPNKKLAQHNEFENLPLYETGEIKEAIPYECPERKNKIDSQLLVINGCTIHSSKHSRH